MRGATQLMYVEPGSDVGKPAENAKWLMDHVIYLPLHQIVPDDDFNQIINRTIEAYLQLVRFV